MDTQETNEALIRRWIEVLWNQKDPAIIDELLTDKTLAHGMGPNGTTLVGKQSFQRAFELLSGAFPDLQITIDQLITSGDWVASHMTCTGTHNGDQLGIPASGQKVTFFASAMARIEDGKIVEGRNVIDLLSALQQIRKSDLSADLP